LGRRDLPFRADRHWHESASAATLETSLASAIRRALAEGEPQDAQREVCHGHATEAEGATGLLVSGGDTHLANGGAAAVLSAGSVTMEQSGSGVAIARRIRVAHGGLAVFAVTPHLEVQEGGRVLFGRAASIAVMGGILSLIALWAFSLRRRATHRPAA